MSILFPAKILNLRINTSIEQFFKDFGRESLNKYAELKVAEALVTYVLGKISLADVSHESSSLSSNSKNKYKII